MKKINIKKKLIISKNNEKYRQTFYNSNKDLKLPRCVSVNFQSNKNKKNDIDPKLSKSLLSIFSRKKYISTPSYKGEFPLPEFLEDDDVDVLKEQLLKTKKLFNEQNTELNELKLSYNRLYHYHQTILKLLEKIINKAGVNGNVNTMSPRDISEVIDGCQFNHIITKKQRKELKEKHLITCFKTKMLEYKKTLEEKNNELYKIKDSSRFMQVCKLQSENTNKNLQNRTLFHEKKKLGEKIDTMGDIIGDLNEKCLDLEKKQYQNKGTIDDLQIKLQNDNNTIYEKDQIIENLNEKIKQLKSEKEILERKVEGLSNMTGKYENQYKKIKSENEKLMDKNNKLEKDKDKEMRNAKKENDKLKSENEELKSKLSELSQELEKQKKKK